MAFGKRNGEERRVLHRTQSQLPMLGLADSARNNLIAVVGEFVGTFLFLFFSFAGTQVSNTPKPVAGAPPNTSNLLYSALSFGFSLTVNIWAFYRVTGGLFNPVVSPTHELQHNGSALTEQVSLALCLVGGMPPLRGVLVFMAQLVGGIAAAGVVSALFPGDLNVGTRLGGGASISQGLFIEMFLTAQLVFVIIMLAVVKHKSTFLAPVGIGLTFFVTEMIGMDDPNPLSMRTEANDNRRLLYGGIAEPRALAWPGRDQPELPWLSLDLLGWTAARVSAGLRILRLPPDVQIRVRQPGAGL